MEIKPFNNVFPRHDDTRQELEETPNKGFYDLDIQPLKGPQKPIQSPITCACMLTKPCMTVACDGMR